MMMPPPVYEIHDRSTTNSASTTTSSSGLAVLCAFIMSALSEFQVGKNDTSNDDDISVIGERNENRTHHLPKSASWSTPSSNDTNQMMMTIGEGWMMGNDGTHLKYGSREFGYMLKQLHPKLYAKDPSKMNVRRRWIIALTQCVSAITKDMGVLIDTLFSSYDWLDGEDDQLFTAYATFIENMVSANAYMAVPCMKMLTKSFRYRKINDKHDSREEWVLNRSHQRAHQILLTILDIVPTAPSNLIPLIAEEFPDKRESYRQHVYFLKNILILADSIPILLDQILTIIIEKLIQIDLEIQVEIDDFDDDDEVLANVFRIDDDEDDDRKDSDGIDDPLEPKGHKAILIMDEDESDEESHQQQQLVLINVHQLIRKLDRLLALLFDHLDSWKKHIEIQGNYKSIVKTRLEEYFSLLLGLFDRIILKTHRCRYVQFMIFYAGSQDTSFPDMFLGFLAQKLVQSSTTPVERQSAIAYLASFIARATYVQISSVKVCLDLILPWIHAYLDEQDSIVIQPDLKKHSLFYAMCQALFYIYCFRHVQLAEHFGIGYARQWGLERIIHSRLNPLKLCAPSVVNEFSRLAHIHEVVYCYVVLEKNRKSQLSMLSQHQVTVETFFPFDPCRLKESSQYISNYYQEWNDTSPDENESTIELTRETVTMFPLPGQLTIPENSDHNVMSLSDPDMEPECLSFSPESNLLLARFEMHSPHIFPERSSFFF